MLAISLARAEPPDIVIVLADDMGYSDIGCYGGEVRTPAIDGLAANGLRFTRFYNAARCCPTRASLLTGLYPHQAGVGHMVEDRGKPGYRGRLNNRCVTMAEVLRAAGYHTAMAGKWHVTPFDYETSKASDRGSWPLQRGFERFTGSLAGGGSYYRPKGWMVDNEFVSPGEGFYYTDAVTDAATRFIGEASPGQPLFLYVAYTAPHWPLHAREEDIARYEGVYEAGWDAIREARYQRMVKMGLINGNWPLSPRDARVEAWATTKDRNWRARQMAAYAAMIDRMDQGIGKIVEALRKRGRFDNTLVLFLADNGGCEETPGLPGIRRFAAAGEDISRWGNRKDVPAGPRGTFQSYGIPWANASNTPFRWYKSEVHEGGISSPLVAHWPAKIRGALRGSLVHDPAHLIDLMATSVDLAGARYPAVHADREVQPMEGITLRPAFEGKPLARGKPLFFEHEGNRAVIDGSWKLVAMARGPWELYDLAADRTEEHNLAPSQPERRERMASMWTEWAKRANVTP
ncbi:MAG: arylsulfatase [Akkermansiaceae bacterium]|nr:arylsulfatase [Akkermansiaceae bacterium]